MRPEAEPLACGPREAASLARPLGQQDWVNRIGSTGHGGEAAEGVLAQDICIGCDNGAALRAEAFNEGWFLTSAAPLMLLQCYAPDQYRQTGAL
jgi:hypothetical protein